MCELFALSARHPTTIRFSFERFAARGGAAAPNSDGWGVAFYEGRDVRLLREPEAATDSPLVRFIEAHGPRTSTVISHVRHATQGARTLSNTQPFARELAGRIHVFAHNGDLASVRNERSLATAHFKPVGDTDSEYAFCALLARMEALWESGDIPPLTDRLEVLGDFARVLRTLGPANFIYADSEALFAHADRRHQADGTVRPPGLWRLKRHCAEPAVRPEFIGIALPDAPQDVVLFASVPLTDEPWEPLGHGVLAAVRAGESLGE